jgi:hypothetical protein
VRNGKLIIDLYGNYSCSNGGGRPFNLDLWTDEKHTYYYAEEISVLYHESIDSGWVDYKPTGGTDFKILYEKLLIQYRQLEKDLAEIAENELP